jgi:hypothetical protein
MEGLIPIEQADFDLAIKATTSFYQSKRAQLKKQVTHFFGKFTIVKNENNVLRKMNRRQSRVILEYMELYGQLDPEILRTIDKKKVGKPVPVFKRASEA